MSEPLIDLEEVRRQLGFKNIDTVRRICRRGEMQAYKLGRDYKTTQAWIDDYLTKRLVQSRKGTIE